MGLGFRGLGREGYPCVLRGIQLTGPPGKGWKRPHGGDHRGQARSWGEDVASEMGTDREGSPQLGSQEPPDAKHPLRLGEQGRNEF